MLTQRISKALIAIALLLALSGPGMIVADSLGFEISPPAYACQEGTGTGGC